MTQYLREGRELRRRLLGDVLRRLLCAEGEGGGPDASKLVELLGVEQVVEREGGDPLDAVSEVGVHLYGL